MSSAYGVVAVLLVVMATVLIGAFGIRLSRTTSDFYVASRTVSPLWNASAIGGEYLSGASFLGIAGLILAHGADLLWLPVGWTGGYLVLLVLISAPLRRSGAYTLPDFAEARLESMTVRRTASVLVVLIGWLYLMPQFQSAGLVLRGVTGAPVWVGGVLVAVVVAVNVLSGGMRSITFVQAFQYWLKLTALALPLIFVLIAWNADGRPTPGEGPPVFRDRTTVTFPSDVRIKVSEPVAVTAEGVIDDRPVRGPVTLDPGTHEIRHDAKVTFPAGTAVPHMESLPMLNDEDWALPLQGRDHPVYATYSLILATFLGTMGLPHVLVRFYTNPDGRAARRTTLAVLALLGTFYLLPAVYGALGRLYTPELLMTGRTDAVVLTLPGRLVGGVLGELLTALVAAGAFAAFLSTSSGLTVSVAGVLGQDILGGGVRSFRIATVLAVIAPLVLAITARALAVADVVGLAFAVAASSFCPLLVLGIWWRRLTTAGAMAGLLVGGGLAGAAVVATIVGGPYDGWTGALLAQPAAWTVPIAFLVMIVVSLLTPRKVPLGVARTMVRLHTPETLNVDRGDWRPRSA
ncbi:cation acetate symporter [Thermopolyspora flexuosa]|uniref:Sodium:solute symporter family protein n=1 Tax=Thermopolyspora flexuosa TaxID=103836 RepID=A0A543IWA0_9ACTN|nr:cation acetate symporter [Thermopolyspora flexuosa]TQM74831.1 sodium:solute symporter family protein [Thermopolyspora flexuosa]GGM79277.1 cation acetate symporter [Thermopolyspora flexuosa]